MICPKCGASNRDGASYCDSCGEALVPGLRPRSDSVDDDGSEDEGGGSEPLVGSGGLVGWMAMDWFLRFAIVAVIGIVAGVATLAIGVYAYSAFFFILGVVGIVGTWYLLKAKR